MSNPFTLQGKRILVTGASSGIGKATAILCASMEAHLSIVGRNPERLQETFDLLKGEKHTSQVFDVTDTSAMELFLSKIDKLDGVVLCAGTLVTCPIKMINRSALDDVFEVNFFSIVNLITILLQKKKINKGASLVFVSSMAYYPVSEIGNAIYSASKGAITSFSRVLALELSSRKIRVNCIVPGMIKTPFLKNFDLDEEQFIEDEKQYPLGYGEPEDVANGIVYLLSNASKWITGTNLLLDGGLTLH